MTKYTERLVDRMASLIETDTYSITEICEAFDINRDTFYQWKEHNPGFRKRINEAIERRDAKLVKTARSSLKKKLEGYTMTEERSYYEPSASEPGIMLLKKMMIKPRHKAPDLKAIKYVLDREEIKKKQE